MELESQNSKDARVEELWSQLDPQRKGVLDFKGLKKGLRKIDHPLKNADDLLRDVMKVICNGDGQKISYEDFRTFVEHTEKELLDLFRSIDRDNNGKLDKNELQAAFKLAGLTVPSSKLDKLFDDVDANNDGVISYDEWRNFLLFIPSSKPGLKVILSYYTSTVTVNAEGDTQISEETAQGLGIFSILFGSIINIASPYSNSSTNKMHAVGLDPSLEPPSPSFSGAWEDDAELQTRPLHSDENVKAAVKISLTDCLPQPGYFAAGGLAGAVSRTSTAPLDRLKVYLIANTGAKVGESLAEAKQGNPTQAVKVAGRPLIDASKELWRAGGIRSLFAGNGLNVVKVMPESAFKFGSYEAARRLLAQLEGHGDPLKINWYNNFLAGGAGGMASQLVVYPLDTLKFRMQCEVVPNGLSGNALIAETAKKMWRQGGMRTYYRGLTMGLVGMFPYSAIDLGTFHYLKSTVVSYNAKRRGCHEEDAKPGSFLTALIGGFSGAFGASIVYPLNVLRTRLQAQGTLQHPTTYNGWTDVLAKTLKNEGYKGLYKGITPNLLKVVPSVSITYVVYEKAKGILALQ